MLKICLIFGLLFLCTFSGHHCEGEQCDDNGLLELTKITVSLDENVRRVFWYYLRNSNLFYQLAIETPSSYLLFFIYRNGLGTFLSINEWVKADKSSDIITFVNLGSGYRKDIETLFSPVHLDPHFISLRLAKGQYLVETNDEGKFVAKGKILEEKK